MPLQSEVHSQLSALKTHDDAAKLFSLLNYEYTAQTVSLKRFPSSLDGRINTLQILAGHEDFKIFHCEVDQLILGVERPIIDNLLKDHPYSLFLFSDASKNAWHFINVKYDEEETRRKLFRRIVIGPDERLHTAAQRIALLEVPDARTLSPLELQQQHDKAFDVEVVTKEFFNSFVQMFHLLREEIEELNPRYKTKSAEFSQLLLNRLMFLYFIQKKGWLDGNASYLYERYKKGYKDQQAKHTYYSEVLLLIFKKLANTDLQFKQLGNIPFLNGGLFESEPWEDVLKISNGLFGKLFRDLFEHYNFTVREDTAMDMEVAIDPEMLGKVFENLILQLEKNPTTDLRKATGSYYTPRVIVHFMCQQSLKEYLIENCISATMDQGKKAQTREKIEKLFTLNPASLLTAEEISWLKSSFTHDEAERMKNLILNCRVCDPAVGSGAFVVGMLHEMVAIIKLLDMLLIGLGKIQERNYDYELKRKIIEYCLYGVDIQEQAVRICELRLWLSLVVDYQGKDIPPLPNLSYRIRQGNSLIDKLFGYPVNMNIPSTTERGEKLKQLIDSIQNDKHAYFYESDIQKKRKAELGILAKQCDLASLYLKLRQDIVSSEYEAKYGKGLFGYKELRKAEQDAKDTLQKEIKELEKLILFAKNTKDKLLAVVKGKLTENEKTRQLNETFVWKLDFAEVFREKVGFDIVIQNPPYVEFKRMTAEEKSLHNNYVSATGKYDRFVLFIERSRFLLNTKGTACLINPTTFMRKDYGQGIRDFIRLQMRISQIHDFTDFQVFEGVTNYTGVYLLLSGNGSGYTFSYHRYKQTNHINLSVLSTSLIERASSIIKDFVELKSDSLVNHSWNFNATESADLLNRIISASSPLRDYVDEIFEGIASGKDEVFYVDQATVKSYKIENSIIFPLLKGRDVKAYRLNWSGNYVIYPYDEDSKTFDEHRLKKQFPKTYDYLKEMRALLSGRGYFERSSKAWYELWNQRKLKNFMQLRIVSPEISNRNNFALADKHFGNTKTYHIILRDKKRDNYLFFLGILNSDLIDFVYKTIATPHAGGFFAYKTQFLNQIPIQEGDTHTRRLLTDTVNRVTSKLNRNPESEVAAELKEINQLVFSIYGLSKDDIRIVEANG